MADRSAPRMARLFFYFGLAILLLILSAAAARADDFVVRSNAESGPDTLTQALLDAQATAGPHRIYFDIASDQEAVIRPVELLPAVTETTAIIGYNHLPVGADPVGAAAQGFERVVIDGSQCPGYGYYADGFYVMAPDCTVRGLVIHSFLGCGVYAEADGLTVADCYIGVDAGGQGLYLGCGYDAVAVCGNGATIGGTQPSERNVLSGNWGCGAGIYGGSGNQVLGNYIGVAADGTTWAGNGGAAVYLSASSGNLVGGPDPGAGNVLACSWAGVAMDGASGANHVVGNLIGTDATGNAPAGNGYGVRIEDGDDCVVADNVITDSFEYGVYVVASTNPATGNTIAANHIGVGDDGLTALGNTLHGVFLWGASATTVDGNLVGANGGNGVYVSDWDAAGNTITANTVGVAGDGVTPLGNAGHGVCLYNAPNTLVRDNTISANGGATGTACGVFVSGSSARGNQVQANRIGTDSAGQQPVGNSRCGILITGASDNTVGGDSEADGNTIACNGGSGVTMTGASLSLPVVRNKVRLNRIFENGGLGIDVGGTGVTVNDTDDADVGANNQQNFPVLDQVSTSSAGAAAEGTVPGSLTTSAWPVVVDFYTNTSADGSGFGEGRAYLASVVVAAPGPFTAPGLPPLADGTMVSATATDSAGNTSEFGPIALAEAIAPPDTEPPVIEVPGRITVEQQTNEGAEVTFAVTATDNGVDVPVVCDPASGSLFPLGVTTVQCTAADAAGNQAAASFEVEVTAKPADPVIVDNTPPTFSLNLLKGRLPKSTGKWELVATVTDVQDNLDPAPAVEFTVEVTEAGAIVSRANKWKTVDKGNGTWEVWLLAEEGANGVNRHFNIVVTVSDGTNVATQSCKVIVGQGNDKPKK